MPHPQISDRYLVKIVRIRYAHHPQEKRLLKPGEVIEVSHILYNKSVDTNDGKSLKCTVICYHTNFHWYGMIPLEDCELMENITDVECHCKSLLFGHEPNCLYPRSKKG